ncbi:MAG: TorF family putative porin [Sphingopyxis sp.]
MTRLFAAALFLSPMLAAAPAAAQEVPGGGIDLSGGVDLVSDYRYRGLSLSDRDVAVQPTITISHDSGFYVGAWGSNIDRGAAYGDVEVDLYGGYETEIASGTRLDVGLTYYWHLGGDKAFGPSDHGEATARLSYMLGPVEASGRVAYAWDQAALGSADNLYLNLGLSAGIPNTPVTLAASIGRSDGALAPGGDYLDWSIGAKANFGRVALGLKYVDTDIRKTGVKAIDRRYDATVVASVGLAF